MLGKILANYTAKTSMPNESVPEDLKGVDKDSIIP
jgi:hypothetical protein